MLFPLAMLILVHKFGYIFSWRKHDFRGEEGEEYAEEDEEKEEEEEEEHTGQNAIPLITVK